MKILSRFTLSDLLISSKSSLLFVTYLSMYLSISIYVCVIFLSLSFNSLLYDQYFEKCDHDKCVIRQSSGLPMFCGKKYDSQYTLSIDRN